MFLLMLFMFFFFIGFVAMYAYLLRKLDAQNRAMNEEHAQMRVLLRAMESRLDKLGQAQRINAMLGGQTGPDSVDGEADDATGNDSLLHLSFEKPHNLAEPINPGLSLDLDPVVFDGNAQKN